MRFVRERTDPPAAVDLEAVHDAVAVDGVALAVVYGSYATDNTGPLSDLDVAVSFTSDAGRERKLRLLDELTVAIQQKTGIESVDLIDLGTAGPVIGYDALSRGVIVYGEHEKAIDLESKFLLRKLDFQPVRETWQAALDDRLREGTFGRR